MMGTEKQVNLEELLVDEKHDKEMYRQALFELYQTTSFMLTKDVKPEEVKKQLEKIKEILAKEGFDYN